MDELVCGYSQSAKRNTEFAVMHKGFCDDSSGDKGEKLLLLAGCVARYDVWANFCFDWELALAEEPRIEYFKMREARLRVKQFAGWRVSDSVAKIRRLSEVIAEHSPRVVATYISRKDFTEVVSPVVPYMLRHPYNVLFYVLIGKTAQWQYDSRVAGKTQWVFDEQGPVGAESVVWYGGMKGDQAPHLMEKWGGTPVFRDDKDVLPLQAADLVAWHRRRRVEYPDERVANMPSAAIEELITGIVPVEREYMVRVAEGMALVPGIDTVRSKPRNYVPGLRPEDVYGDIKEQ
jgi:Protein of unknown function (DUF3800)